MSTKAESTLNQGAAAQPHGSALPHRLASLISPTALEKRNKAVQARLGDAAQDRVFQRRSAEVIANHLLTALSE
jgi:hypothetical protein